MQKNELQEIVERGREGDEIQDNLLIADSSSPKVTNGLAKLVLTLLETLKELMERQARRRMKEGTLAEQEVERLGLTFMQLNNKISEVAKIFNLERKDLTLGLSSANESAAGKGGVAEGEILSLVDLLDRVVEKGVIVFGDLGLSVADVELINVQLRLVVNATRRGAEENSKKSNVRKNRRVIAKNRKITTVRREVR